MRLLLTLAILILCLLPMGCGETWISPYLEQSDSQFFDTDTSLINDSTDPDFTLPTDSDAVAAFERIPFVVPSGANIDYAFIPPESNAIGAQGLWYQFSDDASTMAMSLNNGTICGDGALGVADSYTPYAALGLSFCYAGSQDENAYEMYTSSVCPFVPDFDKILIGISFELTKEIPDTPLFAYFLGNDDTTYFEFELNETGKIDLFFENATLFENSDGLHLEELRFVQFQVNNERDTNEAFHYCFSNVELLIQPI